MLDGTRGVEIRSACSSSCILVLHYISQCSFNVDCVEDAFTQEYAIYAIYLYCGIGREFSLHSFNGNISMKQFCVCCVLSCTLSF